MTKVLAIVNKKGGCGKTTTAVNLSAALAINNKRVLLLDLDPQAQATYYLGVDHRRLPETLFNLFTDKNFSIYRLLEKTKTANLFVVPASDKMYDLDSLISKSEKENLLILKKKIKSIRGDFDYIIMDSPPNLGILALNAMIAATDILVPLQTHYLSLMALKELVSVIEEYVKPNNEELKATFILPTMCDFREKLTTKIIDEVKLIFGDKVLNSVIRKSVKLAEAPQSRKTIITYEPYSAGAIDHYNLARELIRLEREGKL